MVNVVLLDMRMIKSPAEIELLRHAGELSAQGLCGAMDNGYAPIVAGGENAFLPHYSANNCALRDGDLVLASVRKLEKQFEHLRIFYADGQGGDTVKAFAVALPDGIVEAEQLGESFRSQVKNMQGWVQAVDQALRKGE